MAVGSMLSIQSLVFKTVGDGFDSGFSILMLIIVSALPIATLIFLKKNKKRFRGK